MLGRKNYTREELETGRMAIDRQLYAYEELASVVEASKSGAAKAALAEFEPQLMNALALELDRFYVHRLRGSTGKDGNALNELELIADSLINHAGVFHVNNVIKFVPEESVTKLQPGDKVTLTSARFSTLKDGFFSALNEKFVKS